MHLQRGKTRGGVRVAWVEKARQAGPKGSNGPDGDGRPRWPEAWLGSAGPEDGSC